MREEYRRRLREYSIRKRNEMNLTQMNVAERSNGLVTRSQMVSGVESANVKDSSVIDIDILLGIAEVYGVSLDTLLLECGIELPRDRSDIPKSTEGA